MWETQTTNTLVECIVHQMVLSLTRLCFIFIQHLPLRTLALNLPEYFPLSIPVVSHWNLNPHKTVSLLFACYDSSNHI